MAQDNMAAGAVNLEGRSAIVTGAGSGIGRAMALTFARAGAEVMVNDIIATRADETVAMIEKDGGKAVAAIADIADETAVGSFVDAAMRSEEHTSELQSLMRISYAVFCLKQKTH